MKWSLSFPGRISLFLAAAVVLPAAARGATLFQDDFTRGGDPGPLTPWISPSGNWTVTGGKLVGGPDAPSTYGYVFLTNVWTDFSAQATVQMPADAFGCGFATRWNPTNGTRYAAWIYPAGSPGGSNVLRLLKFQDWTSFSVMEQVNLPSVGTNVHTLKLVARTNRLAASYDGVLVVSATDPEVQPYLAGGVGLEMWTDGTLFSVTADDVLVSTLNGVAASNDSYAVRQGYSLNVAAPGVLSNDTTELGPLTALLNAGPAHGTLNLSSNGGFSYVPVPSYTGPDSFTYRTTDLTTTSGVATVSLTVTANHAPVAANNSYSLMANTTLTIPAAGVLTNDTDADGDSLTAVLASAPTHGTLNLSSNGGFTYAPSANYVGNDSFTYRASDGIANSGVATVSLSVTAFTPWFSDNFNRASLSPWVVQDGNWAITGGILGGGPNAASSYGHVYLPTQWIDYSVQAQVQLSTNGFGGGLFGRLNPATGARYAAWIYPEGSPGGSRVLKLLKFQNWTQFSLLQQTPLPVVGTNWHLLELAMRGNRVAIHFDNTLLLSGIDPDTQPLPGGGVGLDLWTGATPWKLSADNLAVSPIHNVLATNDSYSLAGTSTVLAPGVLANDAGEMGGLTALPATGPAHGTVTINSDGGFTYTPTNNYAGPDSFTYRATDGSSTSDVATVTLIVSLPGPLFTDDFTRTNPPGALAPWLVHSGNWSVSNGLLLGGTNSPSTYGNVYLTNIWTDYEVQARVQFPAGAYGGGVAGRLNPVTGARYGLWVYPEGSVGGSSVWKLLRFQDWQNFTILQQGGLVSVGTNWHTLKIRLQGSAIKLYYDGLLLTSTTDPQAYLTGGVGLELWTDDTGYVMTADDAQVSSLSPDVSVTAVGIEAVASNQTVAVTFQGAAGAVYQVLATTNLGVPNSWVSVSTNTAGGDGRWTFTDSLINNPRRCYRAYAP